MEYLVILGRIQTERFIPMGCFRNKGNIFRGIPFFSLLPEFPEISVSPFVYIYQCQALYGNTFKTEC